MNDLTRAFLADTRTIAPDQIERLVEARLSALSNGVVQAVSESLAAIRRDIASKLNQSARRLRASETEEQWSKAIVDSTLGFADRAALFLLRDGELHLAATRVSKRGGEPGHGGGFANPQRNVRADRWMVRRRTRSQVLFDSDCRQRTRRRVALCRFGRASG
jgi:hypothetical protein